MRNAFADEIVKLAASDPRIVLLSGDIGNRLFDPYKKQFPGRFYNCGVAEANMASVAAGMALCGLRPVTYTIAPFNTTRCLEQIRNDICYHKAPVLIVGTGAGLSYASLGCTHHSCEDISFLRSIPNMSVLCPADAMELKSLLREALKMDRPAYMRIGKTGEPVMYPAPPDLVIGKGHIVRKGSDLCLFSTGNMLSIAGEACQLLEAAHVNAELVSLHTVKPLDTELLKEAALRFPLFATLEEHSLIGGLGSSIAEWIVDQGMPVKLVRFGTQDRFPHPVGSQNYIRNGFGLNAQTIASQILRTVSLSYAN